MMERSPIDRLYWLMNLFIEYKIKPEDFCNEFHQTYEHELVEQLGETEKSYFMSISQKGARFSEFEEDHIKYPNVYTTEEQMRKIVIEAIKILKQ